MAVGETYRLSFDQTQHGILCTNVFYYEQTVAGNPGENDSENLVNAFGETNVGTWANNLNVSWQPVCIRGARILPEEASEFALLIPGNPGQVLGEGLPANQVAIISTYTTEISKRGRGRTFLSGLSITDESDNHLTPGGATNVGNIALSFGSTITLVGSPAEYEPRHYSKAAGMTWPISHIEAKSPLHKLRNRTPAICVLG